MAYMDAQAAKLYFQRQIWGELESASTSKMTKAHKAQAILLHPSRSTQ